MTYRCEITPELAAIVGCEPHGSPMVYCDDCGNGVNVLNKTGMPAQWFMKRKSAPGWAMRWNGVGGIDAKCPLCRANERTAR